MREKDGFLTSAGTGCFSRTSRFLRIERGLAEDDVTVLSLRGLKRRECATCTACEDGGQILSVAEREGATPCSAAESLRRGGADAEMGLETGPQQGQGAHHATRTRLAAPWMN